MDAAWEAISELLHGYLEERYGSDATTRMDAIPAGNPDALLREWVRSTSQIVPEPRDGPDGVPGARTDHQILSDAHKATGCTGEPIVTYSGATSTVTNFRCVAGCPLSQSVRISDRKYWSRWWLILSLAKESHRLGQEAEDTNINRITNHLAEHCRDKGCSAHT